MEGQKRPRVFLQKRYNTQKRFLALMLAFAMIFTSVGTDLNVAYAAEGNRVDFEIYGADLVEAINDAVETQSPVTADDLNFTNGAIEKFDALFFGEGKVYEVFPPVEGGDMDAEVRVFVRLPEDADDMYMVTGDEEVIFLYINNGEDTISCSTKIIRTVDGEEKVKSTKRITVKSYEDKFGEEESNIISKPEETLPAVPETSAPESQPEETPAETLTPAETTAPEETTVPEETEAPDATEESSETEETTEAPESTEAQETETSEETKEETTEAETEATEAEKEETEAVEETEEPETEADEEKSQDDSAVTLSSISRHQVPVVAVKEDAEPIETEEVSETEAEEETEKETEAETEETEAEETEKETTAAPEKETTAAEETTSKETTAAPEESTEATEETSTEAESSEEVTESEEATTAPETQETEETTEAETEAPAETETTAPAETETQAPVQPATPAEPEEGNKPAATDTDLVGMGWCSTAKAYTRTLNELRAMEDIPGYKVTYAINPEYSARIVDGPRGVEEGETLVFGVKNQIGYAVESVAVNGEVIEADTTEDNEDGSKTVWYSVPEVMGEMDVEVAMTENGNHPAVTLDPIEVDGVTIQISAEEGVLPEGVTATASRVNEDVEATVADRMTEDGKSVSSVMAFDINLWLGDQLLDSEIWGGSQKVTVTFSGQPIEENTAEADTVETVYVETVYDNDKAAKEQIANEEIEVAAADVTNVVSVSEEIDIAEAGISAVSFEAEHFSIYAVVGSTKYEDSYEMYPGETLRLYVDANRWSGEGTWSSSSEHVTLGKHGYDNKRKAYYTDITAVSETERPVTVTYRYSINKKQTFKISVNDRRREATAYFYALKPNGNAGSLGIADWLYVGTGKINVSDIKDQNGNPMGTTTGVYSLDVDGRIIDYPDDQSIKQAIAAAYGVDINEVKIEYAPYKITCADGWNDNNGQHDAGKACWHVDMTVSITTKNQASVVYHLWDANAANYDVVDSYMVDKGTQVRLPDELSKYPDNKGDYYFDGWYTNPERTGDKVRFPYTVNEATDFYAKYVYAPEVVIQYEVVGGGRVTNRKDTVKVNASEDAASGSGAIADKGYKFKGWYDNRDGNGNPLSVDEYFKPEKSPVGWEAATYYAVFEPDEGQTKELKATVDYVLGDEVQTEDHKDLTATVQILQPDTLSTQGVEAKEYKGWKLEKITINDKIVQNLPATVNNGDAVRYHYIIDEDQTKELKATVDYKLGAKVQSQDHKDLTATVQVLEPDTLSTEGVTANVYEGWKLVHITINGSKVLELPDKVNNGDKIIYHYLPDEEQTKELKATVDYVLGDEVQTEDHKDLTATVQILQPDTLSTQGVEAKEYKGWKLEKITINDKIVQNLPATVNNGDAVRYHYIIDEDQTKELKATVDYKLGAKVQSQDHKDLTATVQVLEPDTLSTEGVTANVYEGWKLVHITINGSKVLELPDKVNNGDKIIYHYLPDEEQTKELKATVDYVLGDEVQTEDHKDLTATVQILQPDTLSTQGVEAKEYKGWKLEKITINDKIVQNLPATVNNGDAVRYHYIIDEDQTKELKATVDYVLGNEVQTKDHKDLIATVQILEPDILSTEDVETKQYKGWLLEKITINGDQISELPQTVNDGDAVVYHYTEDENEDNVPDKYQVTVRYEAVNGTVTITEPVYVTIYNHTSSNEKELEYAEPGTEGAYGTLSKDQIADAAPNEGYDPATEQWKANGELAEKPTIETRITEDTTYEVSFGRNGYGYDVIKRFLNAAGEEVDTLTSLGTAAYGTNILEASGVKVLQEELHEGNLYELVKVEGADRLITNDIQANHVEVIYQQNAYVYDVVKRYLDANGNEVDAVFTGGTALYGQNILEASDVTVLQEELYEGNLYELVRVDGADRLITNDPNANRVEVIYQQNAYVYDVVKRYLDANGNEVDAVFTGGTALYGQNILEASDVTVLQEELYEGNLYELVRVDGADRLITNDPNANRVEVIYQQNAYVYDVVKRYLDANGNEVDAVFTGGTALYGQNILEASDVTVLQEELYKDNLYELVRVDGADRLITNDPNANRVEVIYQQNAYVYDVVKRYLDANGNEVDAVFTGGTALYGQNILEASDVTVLQEELYEGNLYELVRVDGADRLITNDPNANRVEVIYQQNAYVYDVVKRYLDANGNEVDAVFTGGTALYGQNILEASDVTVLQEELYEGNLYELVRVDGADRLITNDPNANRVEVIYQQNAYVYDVVKRYLDANGNEVDAVFTGGTALYGQNILEASDVTVLQEELYKDNLYELVRVDGADRLITNDPNANRVEIIYQQKNYNYEVVKHYEGLNETAVESTKGTAPYGTGILEMSNVDVLQHETYKDHTYVLVKVDGADKLVTNDETQNRVDIYYALDEKGGTDPTDPTNPDGHPDKYQIIFRYVSADETMGTVSVTKEEVHTFIDEAGNYIDKYPISPNGATAQALEGFAFDYWVDTEGRDYTADMQNMKSQTYLEDTTFTAHFAEDKIGETDPENPDPNHPDNIPDYRQITFRYVSENPSYGTVSGTVVEVRTVMEVKEGENGYQVLETKSVNPFADVTVSANGRYSFERWSDGTTNFANTDEISAASFDADTTFTAYFDYNGGGSSGGGGGGGNGGGPSGSGGDSTGGPGVTVTIDKPEVPLAPAPGTGTGDVISINDGMVPMAPLPKTGQTTMRSTLLMAFSGILLAITGFSKKRKEEEN